MLFDESASDVFNFCLRVAGSRDAAAAAATAAFLAARREPGLNPLAAARFETARRIAEAGDDSGPAASHPVQKANGRLEVRAREVLALRELVGSCYAEIGEIADADRTAVAELLWRARLALHDELNGSRLARIAPVADSCRRALALIAAEWDGEQDDAGERAWLRGHLRTCGKCRVSQKAAGDASVAYRAWAPVPPPLGIRESLLASDPAAPAAAGS